MVKNDVLNKDNHSYWLSAGLLVVILCVSMSSDINRPFFGLHSWARACGAWEVRTHLRYGLGYTKGVATWAVGENPPEKPKRYLDHPQVGILLTTFVVSLFGGVSEWSYRAAGIVQTILAFLIFLKILKDLLDEKTALLAGFIFVLFPLTGFFGTGGWAAIAGLAAMWFYLTLIGGLKDTAQPKLIHKIGLAVSLFFGLQFSWTGFFFAMAIGIHYVARCTFRKQMPEMSLLSILIIAPLSSMLFTFTLMAAGHNWDISKIVELYKWRSAKGEMREFLWSAWFETFWVFAKANFTLPILITAILYLTVGQLFVFGFKRTSSNEVMPSRRFPQFWLFLMIPVFQLFILRGCLWRHQTWEMPLGPFIAIAAALGLMLLWDILQRIHQRLAVVCTVVVIGMVVVFSVIGTNHYFAIRWQSPMKIEMFKKLNQKIPGDKALLSYEDFIVNQHSSKGAFYRPEIAWYLDREIVVARTPEEVEKYAKTGECPYYLVPQARQLSPLINALVKRYEYQVIPGDEGEQTKDGKFFRAGMMPYLIFDLRIDKSASKRD